MRHKVSIWGLNNVTSTIQSQLEPYTVGFNAGGIQIPKDKNISNVMSRMQFECSQEPSSSSTCGKAHLC